MESQEILQLIIGVLAIGGSVFGVFNFFRKPQEKAEIKDAVFDEKFNYLKEIVVNLRDNHIHTVDSKLDKHIEKQDIFEREVCGKLGGIEAKIDMIIKK